MGLFGPPDIGKMREAKDYQGLVKALKHKQEGVRAGAAEALGACAGVLADALDIWSMDPESPGGRFFARISPGVGDPRIIALGKAELVELRALAFDPLVEALGDVSDKVRGRAAETLGTLGDARAVAPLHAVAKASHGEVRARAEEALNILLRPNRSCRLRNEPVRIETNTRTGVDVCLTHGLDPEAGDPNGVPKGDPECYRAHCEFTAVWAAAESLRIAALGPTSTDPDLRDFTTELVETPPKVASPPSRPGKTISMGQYGEYLTELARSLESSDPDELHSRHEAYCARCGVQFSREALAHLHLFGPGSSFSGQVHVVGATREGVDIRSGRCPRCGHTELLIVEKEPQTAVPPPATPPAEEAPREDAAPAPPPAGDPTPAGTREQAKPQVPERSPTAPSVRYCPACGRQRTSGEAFCSGCGTPLTDRPASTPIRDAPARRAVQTPPPGQPPGGRWAGTSSYGGFRIRFVAAIVDAILLWAASSVSASLIISALGDGGTAGAVGMVVLTLLIPACYVACIPTWGAGPGKLILGYHIVGSDERHIGYWRALAREVSKLVSGAVIMLGFVWVGFDSHKQGWHDKIAETYVVRKEFVRK